MPPHKARPTNEMPSMAMSLPRKIASSGTAAASTSMILLVFSSTRVERSRVASIRVMREDQPLADAAPQPRRIIWRLPAACSVTIALELTGRRRAPAAFERRGPARILDEQLDAARRRYRSTLLGPVRTGRSSVPLSTAE